MNHTEFWWPDLHHWLPTIHFSVDVFYVETKTGEMSVMDDRAHQACRQVNVMCKSPTIQAAGVKTGVIRRPHKYIDIVEKGIP